MEQSFIDFLRFCLHEDDKLPDSAKDIDWTKLLEFGRKQSITGVLFHGIKRLTAKDPHPSPRELAQWGVENQQIADDNRQAYRDAYRLTSWLYKETGIKGVVLKGQANALLYPDKFSRMSGDIDLWTTADPVELILWAQKHDPESVIDYHHVSFEVLPTIAELHFVPSFMGNLFYEWRLRKYFKEAKDEQFRRIVKLPEGLGKICVLQPDFDCIFQLTHLMHHFFFEGIGFRQLIDFYYLLSRGFTDKQKADILRRIKWLNMSKFTAAVMYIMYDVLGIDKDRLLCEPNEKVGKLFLREVLKAGNFGFYDERYSFSGMSVYTQYFLEIYRNLHFALYFPSETIWGRPISRWWHMFYKAWLRHKVSKAKKNIRH